MLFVGRYDSETGLSSGVLSPKPMRGKLRASRLMLDSNPDRRRCRRRVAVCPGRLSCQPRAGRRDHARASGSARFCMTAVSSATDDTGSVVSSHSSSMVGWNLSAPAEDLGPTRRATSTTSCRPCSKPVYVCPVPRPPPLTLHSSWGCTDGEEWPDSVTHASSHQAVRQNRSVAASPHPPAAAAQNPDCEIPCTVAVSAKTASTTVSTRSMNTGHVC